MHIKLMQMHRLVEQMHNRKGDWLVVRIDRHPDVFLREIDLGGNQIIVGEVGEWCGSKQSCGSSLNDWQGREIIRSHDADSVRIRHECPCSALSAGRMAANAWICW